MRKILFLMKHLSFYLTSVLLILEHIPSLNRYWIIHFLSQSFDHRFTLHLHSTYRIVLSDLSEHMFKWRNDDVFFSIFTKKLHTHLHYSLRINSLGEQMMFQLILVNRWLVGRKTFHDSHHSIETHWYCQFFSSLHIFL